MSDSDFLLKNVVTSDGTPIDLEVREHRIARIGNTLTSDLPSIDGDGAMVLPGLVDLHLPKLPFPPVETHLRDVLLPAEILDAFFTTIRRPQDANLVFRRIPFAFHRLVLSCGPD